MLKEERQGFILDSLRSRGKALTTELSESLQVSEDTIRRDLKELADLSLVKKVHGGAVLQSTAPFHYHEREIFSHEEKIRLAEKAASELIRPGQVILMDGGTTNVELARRFAPDLKATVITNSLPVATILADHRSIELIFLGGKLLKSAQVTTGPELITALSGIRADLCILGCRSIHPQIGISEIDWDETLVKRALIAAAEEVATLVIASKLGATQPFIICEPRKITTLVTTPDKRDPRVRPFAEQGIDIL